MTIWLYISRRFSMTVLAAFGGTIFLAMMFDTLELARRAGGEVDIGFIGLLGLSALRAPSIALVAAPYIIMLSAMWTCARFARASELVVLRAGGLSGIGIAAPVIASAAIIGALSTTVVNPVSAGLLDRFERLEAQAFNDNRSLLSVSGEGLWLRQGNFSSHSVIHAKRSNSDGTDLAEVSIFFFEETDVFVGRIDADRAVLHPGYWRLEDAVINRLDPDRPEAPMQPRPREFFDVETELTSDQIIDSFAAPETIQFWALPQLIQTLEKQGFSARRHVLHLHSLLAAPLVFAAMALIGAAFSMRHARLGGLGMMAVYAAFTGFGAFFVLSITKALANSGAMAAIPAAWAPPFAAVLLGLGLLLRLEDA